MTLTVSLDDLQKGSSLPGDSKTSHDEKPAWYDHKKFTRGQAFFQRHLAAIAFAMHISLVSGFGITNLLGPLVFTQASDTPEKSLKRYAMTAHHILLWMTGEVWDNSSKAYHSLKTVRNMHNQVAKGMKAEYPEKVFVSQYDMGLVQTGFFAASMLYPEKFGIHCTKDELDDYVFTWRVIGYLLGIDDKHNICTGGYEGALRICKEIEQQLIIPAMENPPKDFNMIADAYIDGINLPLWFPAHSKLSVLALVWDEYSCPIPFQMGPMDWLRFYIWRTILRAIYWLPGFERFLNWYIQGSVTKLIKKLFERDMEKDDKKYL